MKACVEAWWGRAVFWAVAGSLGFGAVAGWVAGWSPWGTALWFTAAAGAGWLVMGPCLWLAGRIPWQEAAGICLATMEKGEAVLVPAAAVAGLLCLSGVPGPWILAGLAMAVLGANGVMSRVFTRHVRSAGLADGCGRLLWWGILNGAGGICFVAWHEWRWW